MKNLLYIFMFSFTFISTNGAVAVALNQTTDNNETNKLTDFDGDRRENKPEELKNDSSNYENNYPISVFVGYHQLHGLGATWAPGTLRYKDDTKSYAVVDISKYAKTMCEFVSKYPVATIETFGKAKSRSPFGDAGEGRFGVLRFDTEIFYTSEIKREYMVNTTVSGFGYYVSAKIGLGFQKQGTTLYLWPFVIAELRNWFYSRDLDVEFTVNRITFEKV